MAVVLSGGASFSAGWQRIGRIGPNRRLRFLGRLPVVRQQRLQVAVLQRRQALEDMPQISSRIVPADLGRFDPAEHHGSSLARLLGAHK
jgi:hypothetical protein